MGMPMPCRVGVVARAYSAREPMETECMAAFTSPETDVDSRWDTEPLTEAQRAASGFRTVIYWSTASETRTRGKRLLGSVEVAGDKERRVISALGRRRRATAEVAGDTADRSPGRGYAKGPLRGSGALGRTEDAGESTQASVLAGLAWSRGTILSPMRRILPISPGRCAASG